jgi:chromosomal replication initiation ATPase DnaA
MASGRGPITEASAAEGILIWTCQLCHARALWRGDQQLLPDPADDELRAIWLRDARVKEGVAQFSQVAARLAERVRKTHGQAVRPIDRRSTGRPVEITWKMVDEARQQLRSEGAKSTQQAVADFLRCSLQTVKSRTREHGGWRTD